MEYTVGNQSFTDINLAAAAAKVESQGGRRSSILAPLRKGVYGYQGQQYAVAQFFNGQDVRALAADEDGEPDLDARAEAL